MFRGTASFLAKIRDNGLKFASFDFNPDTLGVEKVAIEGTGGHEISSTVHLSSVASQDEGRAIAEQVNANALDRIAFFRRFVVENARLTDSCFFPLDAQSGASIGVAQAISFADGVSSVFLKVPSTAIKIELELVAPPGERNFALFRSALLSTGPVERFMHLYHILLMLFDDEQKDVDAFIDSEFPGVPRIQSKYKRHGKDVVASETIYSRLRNEFAHKRDGVDLDATKTEMSQRLNKLTALTKRATELHS